MNKTILVGRLTKDPEKRGNDETIVAVFTVAVNRPYTNNDGKREADFIQIKTFKKLADNCLKYLKKGSLVSVDAFIRTGSFQKDGKTVFTMEVIADDVRFLDGKKESSETDTGSNQDNQNEMTDDDPFKDGTPVDNDWPF